MVFLSVFCLATLVFLYVITVQWNPINPVTSRTQKSGRVVRVVILKGFFK